MRTLATSYAGITWERCAEVGVQWPAPTLEHPGTRFLHKDGNFARGRGKFNAATWRPPAEQADQDYPLVLSTGRRLYHYHTTQTHHSPGMDDLLPEELVEVNPEDAKALSIQNGDYVNVVSRRGQVKMRAWITDRSPRGVVWSSFHFADAHINKVTNSAYDPVTETAEYKACAVRLEPAA
jgi:formate dehydrogenase major subunit